MEQIRSKLITPEEFDGRLANDPGFADQVGGFGTYSLEHLLKAINQERFTVPVYPTEYDLVVRCYLNEGVLLRLDGTKNQFDRSEGLSGEFKRLMTLLRGDFKNLVKRRFRKDSVADWVLMNRDYGPEWVISGLIESKTGVPMMADKPAVVETLARVFTGISGLSQEGDLINLNQLVNRKIKDFRNEYDRVTLRWWLREHFGTEVERGRFFQDIYRSRGVQFIYGDQRRLRDFIRSDEYLLVDDIGVEVYRPIPGELVKWIIPLGPREQQMLL